jgi:hypothetical protein
LLLACLLLRVGLSGLLGDLLLPPCLLLRVGLSGLLGDRLTAAAVPAAAMAPTAAAPAATPAPLFIVLLPAGGVSYTTTVWEDGALYVAGAGAAVPALYGE